MFRDSQPAKDWKRYLPAKYRKRTVAISRREKTEIFLSGHWDGGSKTDHELHRNGSWTPFPPHKYGSGDFKQTHELQPLDIVRETGTFCGKTATAHLIFHPLRDVAGRLPKQFKHLAQSTSAADWLTYADWLEIETEATDETEADAQAIRTLYAPPEEQHQAKAEETDEEPEADDDGPQWRTTRSRSEPSETDEAERVSRLMIAAETRAAVRVIIAEFDGLTDPADVEKCGELRERFYALEERTEEQEAAMTDANCAAIARLHANEKRAKEYAESNARAEREDLDNAAQIVAAEAEAEAEEEAIRSAIAPATAGSWDHQKTLFDM